jgi:short-subunit dehydrogenase
MKQTILITGASSGFGLLIANKLHEAGHTVIGTSRNPEKYQTKLPFKLLALDIADDNSIESFVIQLFKEISQLDVLINNAGYLLTGIAEETPIELARQQFETNFWGTVKLTNELLPYFRKQKKGKIIITGSFLGLIGHPNLSYYSASKHALEGYFKSLRFELNQFNIKVSMIEPMYFKTNLGDNATTVSHEEIAEYDKFRLQLDAYTNYGIQNAPGAYPVVKTVTKIINEKTPKFSYPIGKGTSLILMLQRFAYNALESTILKNVNKTKI